ncbi:MAG: NAD(+)/NADH kinase [Alistipes sp.]|nr:NAD(+)/NADH kinase [Alistipes senegalensis]MCM1250715.1 NAD(+)/NADH kinase [Alistipes sp.]
MRIILFSRSRLARSAEELRQLFDTLDTFGFDYLLNEEFAATIRSAIGLNIPADKLYGERIGPQPEGTTMVCYGGDGTLLEGIHRLDSAPLPVVGINAGHLGFLTGAPSEGLERIFGQIVRGELSVQPRSMIEVRGDFGDEAHGGLALNEFTVQRHGADMLSVETYVDGQMVATYHGDGVIVSTPTGSTAYSLSAGGPVVAPACACLVISPLAPHNLTMRPVVVPDSSRIDLRVHERRSDSFVTLDNRSYPVGPDAAFTIRRAEQKIFLAMPHNISFYDTLRNKMMWGVDLREAKGEPCE